jgi:hypothetical protein
MLFPYVSMNTRADLIAEILTENSNRLSVAEVLQKLAQKEGIEIGDLNQSVVPATVRQDNKTRSNQGKVKRFRYYGDGDEDRGFISLIEQVQKVGSKEEILRNPNSQIPALIEAANDKVKKQLKEKISHLSWREFESLFLIQILEALGFEDIVITPPTRDGGKDALCKYKRGLVQNEAIVSAKHWTKKKIDASEIQRIRGIQGNADTGIIVTSSKFSSDALREAQPSQNQRSIVLIDGDLIVEICFTKQIGVKVVTVQNLYELDDNFTSTPPSASSDSPN